MPPDSACVEGLRARKVSFSESGPVKGVRTPVRIAGALGPIRLTMRDRREGALPPLMDCELARALLQTGPLFQSLGIKELVYSGTYQYRTRRGSTRLSEHARGLAIDVHSLVMADGTVRDVDRDFEKGVGRWELGEQDDCVGSPRTEAGRLLRSAACRMRMSSVFREVITPDDNSDHDNHFHLEAFPDALTRARALLSPRRAVISDD
jgi:hypothetical protein